MGSRRQQDDGSPRRPGRLELIRSTIMENALVLRVKRVGQQVRGWLRIPRFILVPALFLSRSCGYLWRPAFFFTVTLCIAAGLLRSFAAERPSLFAIYAAGVFAGVGVLTGLLALPTTDGIALEAEELL